MLTITPSLHEITYVHDNGVLQRRSGDEISRFMWILNLFQIECAVCIRLGTAYLQTATVVLEDKRNRAPIAVSRHPCHGMAFKVGGGDWRVMQQAQLIVVSRMRLKEVILV